MRARFDQAVLFVVSWGAVALHGWRSLRSQLRMSRRNGILAGDPSS